MGSPWGYLSVLTNLGGELTLPAWYSSMKLALLGLLFLGLAFSRSRAVGPVEKLALMGLPAIFFALSFDEMASVHETLESWYLDGPATRPTPWLRGWYGAWVLVLLPVLVPGFPALVYAARVHFRDRPRSGGLFALGLGGLLLSALAVEQLGNVTGGDDSLAAAVQIACEEFGEMLGVTLMIWSADRLIRSHGMRLMTDPEAAR